MADIKMAAQQAVDERAAVTEELRRDPAQLPELNVPALRKYIASSEIVVWQPETCELAISGAESFEGLSRKDVTALLPEAVQYWFFNGFDLSNMATQTHSCVGLVYLPSRHFTENASPCFLYVLFPHNSDNPIRFNPTILHETLTLGSSGVVAMCAFMKQKIAAKEPVLLPRSDRRRMQRSNQPIPNINVVRLRGREASIWHGVATRQYHHSWIVRGHWRRLHEPRKLDGTLVTWIESYIKGNGPLLAPRQLVYSVDR